VLAAKAVEGEQQSLAAGQAQGILAQAAPTEMLDLGHAAGASSFAPGAFMDSFPLGLQKIAGLHFDYASPAAAIPGEPTPSLTGATDTLFADGGSYENIPLISYLQRGAARVVYFANHATPLMNQAHWDVTAPDGPMQTGMIDDMLPAFFGYVLPEEHEFQDRSYECVALLLLPLLSLSPSVTPHCTISPLNNQYRTHTYLFCFINLYITGIP
jgi:hypothetical protein